MNTVRRWSIGSALVLLVLVPLAGCEDDPAALGLPPGFNLPEAGKLPQLEAGARPDTGTPNRPERDAEATPVDAGADAAKADAGDAGAVCGNGTVETGETCDPLASCPATCPALGCQLRTLEGAGTCAAKCVNGAMQTACVNADGCCPSGCNTGNDSDCAVTCDNNVIETGETCDPLTSCPSACPALGCQQRALEGAGTCAAKCVDTTLTTACASGDGCCPPGCNTGNDTDCAVACGNNVVEAGETCDPLASCPAACPQLGCTLRTLQNAGTCQAACADSGIQTACVNADGCCPTGCNANNDSDCVALCDNGVVEPGEVCDPLTSCPIACAQLGCALYTMQGAGTCTATCAPSGTQTACVDNDGCCPAGCNTSSENVDNDCAPACGNGRVETGERCDPPGTGACMTAAGSPTCPAASPPGRYTCYGTGLDTCNQDCDAPVLACSTNVADSCCPYGSGGACGTGTDSDCQGGSWQTVNLGSVDTRAGCLTIGIAASQGGSYDFTTCSPVGPSGVGSGNPEITALVGIVTVTGPVIALPPPIQTGAENADCTDPNALPKLAGAYCKNAAGNNNVQACASPSPGGFIAPSSALRMQVCAGPATANPGYPCGGLKCSPTLPGAGVTPLYAYYNATSAPQAYLLNGSNCTNAANTIACAPGYQCLDPNKATCVSSTGCTCQTPLVLQ